MLDQIPAMHRALHQCQNPSEHTIQEEACRRPIPAQAVGLPEHVRIAAVDAAACLAAAAPSAPIAPAALAQAAAAAPTAFTLVGDGRELQPNRVLPTLQVVLALLWCVMP